MAAGRKVLLIMLIAPLLIAGSAAATSTRWNLGGAEHATESSYFTMCKEAACGPATTLAVAPGTCIMWASDHDAGVAATFPRSGWSGNLVASLGTSVTGSAGDYPTEIGYETGNTVPHTLGVGGKFRFLTDGVQDVGSYIPPSPSPSGSFTVPLDNFLTLKVCNGEAITLEVKVGGVTSWVQSPVDSDPFPLPELSALVLSLAGVGLVGVMLHRRRQA